MIQFDELYLIAVIEGKQYRIVFDKLGFDGRNCLRCALSGKPECRYYPCYFSELDSHFYYEEIPKETYNAMRRLVREG